MTFNANHEERIAQRRSWHLKQISLFLWQIFSALFLDTSMHCFRGTMNSPTGRSPSADCFLFPKALPMSWRALRARLGIAVLGLILSCLALAPDVLASGVCNLEEGQDEYDLRPFMEFLEDKEGGLGIDQVASPDMDSRFGQPPKGIFNFSFTRSALWFRFTVAADAKASENSGIPRVWILDPGWNIYGTFELFIPKPEGEGEWQTYSAGYLMSPTWGQDKRHFQLPEWIDTPTTCYIRVTGLRAIVMTPHVTTIDKALESNGFKMLGTGMVLGFFCTMILGHLAIFAYTRNTKFKWFILANISFTIYIISSSYQYLISHEKIPHVIMAFGLISQGLIAVLYRSFLNLKNHNKVIDRFLLAGATFVFVAAVVSFFALDYLPGNLAVRSAVPLFMVCIWACAASIKRERVVSLLFIYSCVTAIICLALFDRAVAGDLPFAHPVIIWAIFLFDATFMCILLAHAIATITMQRQAAEAHAEARSLFLASMSHEIRTPMTAILGFLNLSLNMGATGQLKQYLLKIQTSANHLMGIINDILDLTKIEAGKIELELRPFEMETLLSETADILVSRAFESGNELVLSLHPDVPRRLLGDPRRLKQILVNLGGNAVKFTRNGTVRMSVSCAAEAMPVQGAVTLRFEVSDTGIGIDESILPHLFESFTQADNSTARVFGGTGLGLSISRKLVHIMGGKISAQSQPKKGATFEFTARFITLKPEDDAGPKPDFSAFNALVVEDNSASREAMREALASLGLRCRMAGSVHEARRLATKESFDFALLDWDLPDMTGPEAVERLRASSLGQTPMAIMLSMARPEVEGLRPETYGIQAILAKPFTRSSLESVVKQLVGQKESCAHDIPSCTTEKQRTRNQVRGMRILLAEDNQFNQELIESILAMEGVDLEIVGNGKEAVSRLRDDKRSTFEAVLMDVHMPLMDGYEATRTIRADKRFRALPIIAMTANVMAGDRERCLEAGMNDHLTKPVDTEMLFATLAKWRSRRQENNKSRL
jgi:signal transduction histidine kinase/CheY-like chemotaxis protein